MKQLLITSILLLSVNINHAQVECDSINFTTDTIYINQASDNFVRVYLDYDYMVNPAVAYPDYTITLDDTSNLKFDTGFLGTFLGQQDSLDFDITYVNPSIPNGYTVNGLFNVFDPNVVPNLICQFPIVIIVNQSAGMGEIMNENDVVVYPNPTNDVIHLAIHLEIESMVLADLNGRLMIDVTNKTQINLIDLSTGTYLLIIKTQDGQKFTQRIIKL